MPAMRAVVTETSAVLGSLVNDDDRVDIKQDTGGARRELFSKELEIYLTDIHIDSLNLATLLQAVDTSITTTKDFMKQLNDDENVASNRFTGAIASIMLLPTFIVGLYGQNFDDMPETHWHYGYGFSWMVIVAVTVFQVWFFRRRKWL
jgi:magnesium transporter